jgi:alpha-L-fucosidase
MLKRILFVGIVLGVAIHFSTHGQHAHHTSQKYQWPEDSLVRKKLSLWQDQKFGMIIHWGLYAQAGVIESWSLCSEEWISRDSAADYAEYKKWYWNLSKQFNPVKFNPEQWAKAAKDGGMRYMVFTTKHHDGFSMFDTKQTDFKITNGPFSSDPNANVALHVFDAFRKEGFMVGAYFSKPDWHSEYYWWPKYATPDRNNNYDIRKYPWRWNQFKNLVHNQIAEITTDYGQIDILWLDGGWVRPLETVTDEVRAWGAPIPEWSQDVEIEKVAASARGKQPGLLVVDRTVHGLYENYLTPEQSIPPDKIDYPWESCITLGDAWGYVPGDSFKSSARVIHTLIEVVAKGGSLLLGVGPRPDGTLSDAQITRLAEVGHWLKANGQAIYNTRTTTKYNDGSTFFTKGKGNTLFAIVLLKENEPVPSEVSWRYNLPAKGTSVKLLANGKTVKWKRSGDAVKVLLPSGIQGTHHPALAFSFTSE